MNLQTILSKTALEAAPLLLGWIIVRETTGGELKLRLVETEAYHQDDPASHSHRGKTKHTAPMFKAGGHLYVYFTYGMHYAINIVVGKAGVGEAVLLRAAEPLTGIDIMMKNRYGEMAKLGGSAVKQGKAVRMLSNGPGKLTQALGIGDTSLSGQALGRNALYLEPPSRQIEPKQIIASPRIGITKNPAVLWRFFINGNPYVSKSVYNKLK